jgi:AraC-like DNA-binding protein
MEVKVTLNMWPDLIACSALLTLTAYHLMIYCGRIRDKKEKYNLYFACFVFSAAMFIISPYFQQQYFLNALRPDWLYVINIEMLAIWLFIFSGIHFLNHLLEVSSKFKKNFRFTFISISMCVLFTLTSNLISKEFYFKHVLIYLLIVIAFNVILINFLFGLWIYRKGLYKEKYIKILYLGYIMLTFNILIYRFVEVINPPIILILNHYLTAIILYVFTYALSIKFNKEHYELFELKLNLETRVKERTEHLVMNNQRLLENIKRPDIVIPSKNNVPSIDEQFLQKALQIIEKNINETDFNAEKFCEDFGISRAHLHRRLKALTGKSATEFIRTIKLKRAAELLNHKAASVSEIAYNAGFNNLSYFTRCFKEEFGMVPSEYYYRTERNGAEMLVRN